MFWGITCESGKRYSQIPSEPFRVSMAALEPRDKIPENRFVSLMLEHKGKEFLLCTLEYERSLQVNLNLEFGQGEEMFFFINGEGTIHLSGYLNAAPISPMPPQLVEESASYLYSCNASKAGAAALMALDSSDEDDEDWIPISKSRGSNTQSRRRVNFEPEYQVIDDDVLQLIDDQIEEDYHKGEDDDDDSGDDESEDEENEDGENEDGENEDGENEDGESEDGDEDGEADDEEEECDLVNDQDGDDENNDSDEERGEFAHPGGKRKKFTVPQPSAKRSKKDKSMKRENDSKVLNVLSKKKKALERKDSPDESDDNNMLNSSIGRTPMPKKAGFKKMTPSATSVGSSPAFKPNVKENNVKASQQKYTTRLDSGVEIEDVRIGNGPLAKKNKFAHVFYVGRLAENNWEFDSARPGKDQPLSFRIGRHEVIDGWDQGIMGMRVGGKRMLKIPPHLAYGKKGNGPIPPNSTLLFTIELKAVS